MAEYPEPNPASTPTIRFIGAANNRRNFTFQREEAPTSVWVPPICVIYLVSAPN
jgi:hypothetical protein